MSQRRDRKMFERLEDEACSATAADTEPTHEPHEETVIGRNETIGNQNPTERHRHERREEDNRFPSPTVSRASSPHVVGLQYKEHLSYWRLLTISAWTIACSFGYNAIFVFGTPLFLSLGMGHFWASVAFLVAPISGLIVQPVAGVYSDRCTLGWGRRRPFILVGAILTCLGMFVFPYPTQISGLFGVSGNALAITIAVFSLTVMSIGLNLLQGPAWALVLDLCPSDQQSQGNSVVSLLSGFAGLACNLIGAVNFSGFLPFVHDNNVAIFWLGFILVIVSVLPTLIFAREVPLSSRHSVEQKNLRRWCLQRGTHHQ
mmetsp:Transcript_17110/g.51157  ORF Transcript_17110/g.51157 Transcript_17110/m.51157 type:complete len:316 (-) Transcript_17110:757-1704(-)